ncbi:endoxylanase [Chania multitudinisentens RB-25]|uniref:Endoxylanase n=2 Tax=Chania TaxID=1745211 RepID=W0L712_9GAMM|nr:endoxylanase [Chania multitudinisentens RB-25]
MICKLCIGSVLLLTAGFCSAKTYEIKYTDQIHSLQEATQDAVWTQANQLTDFSFPWDKEKVPETKFRALWTQQAIYFRFDAEDSDIQVGEHEDKDEAVLASDRVELFFSTGKALTPYYTAEMDSRGRIFDAHANYYRQVDPTWNWRTLKTIATPIANGYRVVGKVDIAELDQLKLWQDDAHKTLMCAILRGEFSADGHGGQKRQWISWITPDSVKPDFHIPSAFGTCHLVKN